MSAAKQNWPRVKLGEVCEEIHERIASSEIAVDTYVTTDNMLKNCAGVSVAEYVPDGVGLVRYEKGDVLLANIRPYLKKLWRATHDGGCSSDVVVFRSRLKELSSEYLFAALSQDRFFDYVMLKPRGTKMPRGDRDWMKEFEFPLPPLPAQREIVARLERELGAVDELAKKFDELEQTAEAEFKAELAEEMGRLGQLGQLGRDAAGAGVAVAEVPGVADVPSSPVRWVRLGEVFDFIDYRGKTPTKISAGVPLITAKNIRRGYLDYSERYYISEEEYATRQTRGIAHKGDLLFTTEAPMGYVAVADLDRYSTGQRVIAFQWPDENRCHDNRYFLYYFLSDVFQKQLKDNASGATAQGIKASRLVNLIVAIPPLPTQRAIVARLDAAKGRKEALVSAAKRGREAAALCRKAILKEAFDG